MCRLRYARGEFDLRLVKDTAQIAERHAGGDLAKNSVGHSTGAFAAAPVRLDTTHSTANESHSKMEPHPTIAAWDGDQLTICTTTQVVVDAATGETRVRRMLVCAARRILDPKTARSQVIGAMTMVVGAALMGGLVVDKRYGYFVNHDLVGYGVPAHADIPHQEGIFLDETDPTSSPMNARGIAELAICGVAAAVANAIYNATGVRVRDYPITLDNMLDRLPPVL